MDIDLPWQFFFVFYRISIWINSEFYNWTRIYNDISDVIVLVCKDRSQQYNGYKDNHEIFNVSHHRTKQTWAIIKILILWTIARAQMEGKGQWKFLIYLRSWLSLSLKWSLHAPIPGEELLLRSKKEPRKEGD